ncbi:MAG: hypothetical protein V7607_1915 [Solirubrobacteraceae bacterium]|jgi:hypothetical protein
MPQPQAPTWEIRTNFGRQAGEFDGSGWLWEISRGDQLARVMIEISGSAWSTDPLDLPEDTRGALETDGRTELLKVLDRDDPPRVIRCGSTGCTYDPDHGANRGVHRCNRRLHVRW